ncbi:MAG: DUF6252 family protein [Bacteroidota bacterium]
MIKKNFISSLIILAFSFFIFFSCAKKDTAEIETCFDNIKNQNEVNIDCGGVCYPCPQSMTAKINGNSWKADTSTIKSSYSDVGSKFLISGRLTVTPYSQISLVYLGTFSLGSHDLDHSSSFTPDFNSNATFVSSGTLTISELDTRNNVVSGSFNFTSAGASTTYTVTEGTFVNISYNMN